MSEYKNNICYARDPYTQDIRASICFPDVSVTNVASNLPKYQRLRRKKIKRIDKKSVFVLIRWLFERHSRKKRNYPTKLENSADKEART